MEIGTPVKKQLPLATNFSTPTTTRIERVAPNAPKKAIRTKRKSHKYGSEIPAGCKPITRDGYNQDRDNGSGSLPISIS